MEHDTTAMIGRVPLEARRNTVVVFGPRGCGKTHNAEALAAHFGLRIVVDDWDPHRHVLTPGALHLSQERHEGAAARSFNFLDVKFDPKACRHGLIREGPRPRNPTT